MSFHFNGSNYITPVTASAVDASGMDAKTSSFGNVLALVGATKAINPMTVVRFNSYAEAARQLKDPVDNFALKAIEKAFNPSNETGSPDYLLFVNSKPTGAQITQALLSSTNQTALTLTQVKSGVNLKVVIENGSLRVGKPSKSLKLIAEDGTTLASNGSVAAYYFQLTATTTGLSVTVTAEKLTISNNDFLFSTSTTVGALIRAINDKKIVGLNTIPDPTGPGVNGESTTKLDLIGSTPIGQAAVTTANLAAQHAAGVWITGHVSAVAKAFSTMTDSEGGPLVTVTTATGSAANVANISVQMGVNTVPIATFLSWSEAIDLLRVHRVNWLVPLTDDSAIFNLVNTHCEYMSNTVFMERR
ncbi:MAG: hypothetical protein D4R63_06080, partial [Methylococcaceae bacterium]